VSFWRKAVKKIAKGALDATGRAIKGAFQGDSRSAPEEPPDPFAKLKAAEKAEKEKREAAKNAK
jgi:hypothetical protein